MKTIKLLITLLAISLATTGIIRADISPEKRAEIDRMLKLTGMEKMMGQMATQLIDSLRPNAPELPDEFFTKFAGKIDFKELSDLFAPLYDKYYTVEDLKAVNAFYSSPAGQKILATMPQLMTEAMQIGQQWGMRTAQKVMDEIQKEKARRK